jgi:Transposase DDE domain
VLIRELARLAGRRPQEWAGEHVLSRYFKESIKGQAEIDWSSQEAREEFLGGLVADAERLLRLSRETRSELEAREEGRLLAASQLLSQLLLQDIERTEGRAKIRQGTSGERIPSVHDPEMRHGRKSSTKRFDGHKLGIAVDTEEQLITAVDVMAGSAKDNEDALELVQASEAATAAAVEMAMGDAAYGAGATRREFLNANKKLVAKVPGPRENVKYFTKDRFQIDLTAMTCTCPPGQVTEKVVRDGFGPLRRGVHQCNTVFHFSAKVCGACPLRAHCYSPKTRAGRTVLLHPEEELLAEARALQRSPDFAEFQRRRQVAEHRLARMVQLGMRKARYRGRTKTLFQAALTAAVVNLTLIANKTGPLEPSNLIHSASKLGAKILYGILERLSVPTAPIPIFHRRCDLARQIVAYLTSSNPAFRPGL